MAKSRLRYGTGRAVSPETVRLTLKRLTAEGVTLNCRGCCELFWALQRVLYTTEDGAHLPQCDFRSPNTGRKILDGLVRAKLVSCVDPDSWKPTAYDLNNAHARRYLPTSELLLANSGVEVVSTAADYYAGRFTLRNSTQRSTVQLNPASGVEIPDHVVSCLENGTGLTFYLEDMRPDLDVFPEGKRSRLLRNGQSALGCLGYHGPLHTHWDQKPGGRLYASNPALPNLPKQCRRGLRGLESEHLAYVDFNSFELRLLFHDLGVEAPTGDCASAIAEQCGLERKAVKRTLNAWFHGQTAENLMGVGNRQGFNERRQVEAFVKRKWPSLAERIASLKEEPLFLQRRGATVFFAAYGEALTLYNLPAGIPIHDGWLFPVGALNEAIAVRDTFARVASELLSQNVLVHYELIR